jgi:hypothetical protein
MLNQLKMNPAAMRARVFRAFMLALACVFFVSCKDDEKVIEPDDTPTAAKPFLPEKGQVYHYLSKDADGAESNYSLSILNSKDSSGIEVLKIEQILVEEGQQYIDYVHAYQHEGKTVYESGIPLGVESMITYIGGFADIEDYEISGFPHRETFENKGTAGSKLTFSKEPIKVVLYLKIPVEGQEPATAKAVVTVKHQDGSATKEESVTTPAGTFKCTKWEYTYEMTTDLTGEGFPPEQSEVVYSAQLWTAPGVGIVKLVEGSGGDIETTELQEIAKK